MQLLERAAKSLDEKVKRLEKISDNNAEASRDVLVLLSCEVSILRMVLEDLVRGDVAMRGVGKIDFDTYLAKYNAEVEEELAAKKARETVSVEEETPDDQEPMEFGGDYVKDERTGEATT